MPTPALPPVRCYRCDGKGYLWDHLDDIEFFRPCVCMRDPELVESLEAIRTLMDQTGHGPIRVTALDRLLRNYTIEDEAHRIALGDELTAYLSAHIDTDPDVTRYLHVARFRRLLATMPLRTKLGQL